MKHKWEIKPRGKLTKYYICKVCNVTVVAEDEALAEEWVTEMRLTHVLDKIQDVSMRNMGEIIKNMQADIEREGEGEIIWTREAKESVGQRTVYLLKNYFNKSLEGK